MTAFEPFGTDGQTLAIGGLTIENDGDALHVQGDVVIARDKAGLAMARALAGAASEAVRALEAIPDLPEHAETKLDPKTYAPNPLA